jgi:hypothetical protein
MGIVQRRKTYSKFRLTKHQQVLLAALSSVCFLSYASFHLLVSNADSSGSILEEFIGTPDPSKVTSKLANRAEGKSKWCSDLLKEMKDGPYREHRKQWEFCYISNALEHYGKLQQGFKGLGFAVGKEPLAALFVKRGAKLTLTDMPAEDSLAAGWAKTKQHASLLKDSFRPNIVDFKEFEAKAEFVPVNMNEIPSDLMKGEYDFTYSASSLEHVGSVELGRKFILNAMDSLKVGGVAVHTTEFAINSLTDPGKFGWMSVWLKKDVELLAKELRHKNCTLLPVNYDVIDNLSIDDLPYSNSNHFILRAKNTIHTSIGFIITKNQ